MSADISMLLHVSQVADVSLQLLGGGVGTDVQTLMSVQGEAADLLQTSISSRRRRADGHHQIMLAPHYCLPQGLSPSLPSMCCQLSSLPLTGHNLPGRGLHQ